MFPEPLNGYKKEIMLRAMRNSSYKPNHYYAFIIGIIFFYIVGIAHLGHFSKMPGDVGDGRLNNYFLENIYLYFIGKSDSLIHLSFFYPYPYILGFSDNLFGMAPAYLIPRFLGFEPDTSFQLWFIFGYILNYASCYYVLKRFSFDDFSASIGAIIFTYAPPALAFINHVQLQYRFCIPLASLFFLLFLKERNLKNLIIAIFWTVWQFYCSIYIGFFLLILLTILFIAFLLLSNKDNRNLKVIKPSPKEAFLYLSLAILSIGLMLILLYPYLEVSKLYHFSRSWDEIVIFLPKLRSYILSDGHIPWRYLSYKISMSGIRGEHQLFLGIVPLALLFLAIKIIKKKKNNVDINVRIFSLSLLFFIILTFSTRGFSLWFLLHKLPLFSAIRAVARIILAMLLPISVICAYATSLLENKKIKYLLIFVLFLEVALYRSPVSSKKAWRKRERDVLACIPQGIKKNSILYFTSKKGHPQYATNVDAMLISQHLNIPTINGYSGHAPPVNHKLKASYPEQFIDSYISFTKKNAKKRIALLNRVLTIDLNTCNYN